MALSEMDKYKKRMAHVVGRCSIGGVARKDLTLLKASSHSGVHLKFSFFLMDAKKEKVLSHAQERNLDKAASLPIS